MNPSKKKRQRNRKKAFFFSYKTERRSTNKPTNQLIKKKHEARLYIPKFFSR